MDKNTNSGTGVKGVEKKLHGEDGMLGANQELRGTTATGPGRPRWRHVTGMPASHEISRWVASLAWNLKAWSALMVPVSPRHAAEHEAEKRRRLRMEFATSCAAVIQMPCQIVTTGKRLIYRLLSWTPWQETLLRLVERLHGCCLY